VHVGTSELLGGDDLARGRLDEGRAAKEDSPLAAHDRHLVRHRRHVCAARRAGAEDERQLGDPLRRHVGLVEEDAPKVVDVGEHVGLAHQVAAA